MANPKKQERSENVVAFGRRTGKTRLSPALFKETLHEFKRVTGIDATVAVVSKAASDGMVGELLRRAGYKIDKRDSHLGVVYTKPLPGPRKRGSHLAGVKSGVISVRGSNRPKAG